MEEQAHKSTKIPSALSVYLGPQPQASERLANLDRLASNLGVSRSQMIAMIADGRLMVVVTPAHLMPGQDVQPGGQDTTEGQSEG